MRFILLATLCMLVSHLIFPQSVKHIVPDYANESIDYNLYYGIIKIGEAHLNFKTDGKCASAFIVAEAKSTGLIKFIKDIHFKYESCMDTLTGLPIFDSRILIEGEYSDLNTVYYNHTARADSSIVYSIKTDTVIVPKNIYDLLTGFYDFRANHILADMPYDYAVHHTTFFIDEVWDLNISYHGMEKVFTRYGMIECYIFKPETIVGHFFRSKDAVTIWITKDSGLIPVKFCIQLKIGTLYGELSRYQKTNL